LLFVLMIPFLRNQLTPKALAPTAISGLRRLLTEEEVMAEFLRSEFHHPEFDDLSPGIRVSGEEAKSGSCGENAVRQALLSCVAGRCGGVARRYQVVRSRIDCQRPESHSLFHPRARGGARPMDFYMKDVVERLRVQLAQLRRSIFSQAATVGSTLRKTWSIPRCCSLN